MSHVEHAWRGLEYDAIRIHASRCQIVLESSPDEHIVMHSELDSHPTRNLNIISGGRWLIFDFLSYHGDTKLHLALPVHKTWTFRMSASRGEIELRRLQGSGQILLGRGKLKMDHCRGRYTILTGRADIQIDRFQQTEVPQVPPLPKDFERYSLTAEGEPFSRARDDWESWGEEMGARMRAWVLNSENFLGPGALNSPVRGLNLRTAHGDIHIKETEFDSCSVSLIKGNLEIQNGLTGALETDIHHGETRIKTIVKGSDWNLKSGHGNIQLELDPAKAVRMDMATRNGDIKSSVPLVKVTRQGPDNCRGIRMVGTLGKESNHQPAVLRLSTVRGDIELKSFTANQRPEGESPAKITAIETGLSATADQAPVLSPTYNSTLEVLEALSEHRITIAEAERLLCILTVKSSR
jgi:hypothetical protein